MFLADVERFEFGYELLRQLECRERLECGDIIERGLAKDGRLLRIRVYLLDRPGSLHQLTRILTDCEANIVQTSHNRSYYGVNLGDTVIEITLETRGAAHIAAIADALSAAGYRHERVH